MKIFSKLLISSSLGLEIDSNSIRVVELGKFLRNIKLIKFGEEKISSFILSEDIIIQTIHRLFKRLKIKDREVVLHVGGKGVRHIILDSPEIRSSESLDWIKEQILKRLPINLKPTQLIVSFHVINQKENGFRFFATYCQSNILEEHMRIFDKADLKPVMIGAGCLDLVQAFAFESERFFDQTFCFIKVTSNRIIFIITKNGMPLFYQEVELDSQFQEQNKNNIIFLKEKIFEILSNYQQKGKTKVNNIVWIGNNLNVEFFKDAVPRGINSEMGKPLKGLIDNEKNLSSDYSLAAGLALKKYFPLLNTIDLLPEERKIRIKKQREKRTALKFILSFGVFILIAMITLNVLKIIASNQLDATEEQMFILNDKIYEIELNKKEQNKLQKTLKEMQRLITQRSHYAELLEETSKLMPEYVWLQGMKNESKSDSKKIRPDNQNQLIITGWAFDEEKIAVILSRLENSDFFRDVRLITTERLSAVDVWKRTKLKKIPLIKFMIQTSLKN